MQYHIDKNKNLIITAGDEDREALRSMKQDLEFEGKDFGSNDAMYDAFEHLLCNSELEWSSALEISAMISEYAPVLGVYDIGKDGDGTEIPEELIVTGISNAFTPEKNGKPFRYVVGYKETLDGWGDRLLQGWAYMDYAVRSPQEDLLNYGKAVFTLGWDVESPEE